MLPMPGAGNTVSESRRRDSAQAHDRESDLRDLAACGSAGRIGISQLDISYVKQSHSHGSLVVRRLHTAGCNGAAGPMTQMQRRAVAECQCRCRDHTKRIAQSQIIMMLMKLLGPEGLRLVQRALHKAGRHEMLKVGNWPRWTASEDCTEHERGVRLILCQCQQKLLLQIGGPVFVWPSPCASTETVYVAHAQCSMQFGSTATDRHAAALP